jgi:hypothetical protein
MQKPETLDYRKGVLAGFVCHMSGPEADEQACAATLCAKDFKEFGLGFEEGRSSRGTLPLSKREKIRLILNIVDEGGENAEESVFGQINQIKIARAQNANDQNASYHHLKAV